MRIGVDSCILIAGLHANHPLHATASDWLIRNVSASELVVTHHSVLETYAVMTRLPGEFRVSASEAKQLIEASIRQNMTIAPFSHDSIWQCIDSLVSQAAEGGRSYDCFIAEILIQFGVEAIATFNASHFSNLPSSITVLNPIKFS